MAEFDAATQATIDTAIAAANAAEATGNHAARAQAATQALAAWSAAYKPAPSAEPKTGVEAAARLQHLNRDMAFRAGVLSGGGEHFKTFQKLTEMVVAGDPVDLAMSGHAPPSSVDENAGSVIAEHDLPAAANHLRDAGLPGHQVDEIMRGALLDDNFRPLAQTEIDLRVANAERVIEQAARNPELRRRMLSGDPEAMALLQQASATIALGKRGMP
jgi:hypothetical protein